MTNHAVKMIRTQHPTCYGCQRY